MTTLPYRNPLPDLRDIADRTTMRSIDQHIGQELRALYNEVLAEPIPDRLLALIDELDAPEPSASGAEAEILS